MYYISKSNNNILFIMSNKDIVLLSVLNILFGIPKKHQYISPDKNIFSITILHFDLTLKLKKKNTYTNRGLISN
jgi:hypothetical protein